MSLPLPDKWIRKAVFDALSGLIVDTNEIFVYDSNATTDEPMHYIRMTTQTNNELEGTKCGRKWDSSILLDIVTRYKGAGNVGSRLLADNIAEETRQRVVNLELDAGSGLKITEQRMNFPSDLVTVTDSLNVFRKFIRIELIIDSL